MGRISVCAVMDQGLFAVSNFLLNLFLARLLPPSEYGGFTVAYTVFLLLGGFHTALITEPLLVFGPGRYKERTSEYLNTLLCGHWGVSAAAGLILFTAGVMISRSGTSALASGLLGMALAGPFVLLLWLFRRMCYVRLDPCLAASGGLVYLMLMMAGVFVLYRLAWLTTGSALGVMGVASLVAGIWLAARLRVGRPSRPAGAHLLETLGDHWEYGRWAAATTVLGWVPLNISYVLLPAWQGLEASGALKALMNLVLPVMHANTALAMLLVPMLVRTRGAAEFHRLMTRTVAVLAGGAAVYGGLLVLVHRPFVAWLYGGQYRIDDRALWFLLVALPMQAMVEVLCGGLRALARPDQIFRAHACSSVIAATLGVSCAAAWGVTGAAAGLALSSAAKAAAAWGSYRQSGENGAVPSDTNVAGVRQAI